MNATPLRIAVTGGSGRIGQHVLRELVRRGHWITNLDRFPWHCPGARFVYTELTGRETLQPVLEQADALIHLAEIPSANLPLARDHIFGSNTRVGSMVIQTACDLKLRRLIYTSTCQVYGCFGDPLVAPVALPMDETHPVQPANVYALSKVANEQYARLASERSGVSTAIIRPPGVWSFDASPASWRRLFDEDRPANEMGVWVHAEDVATAMALAVESDRPGCETYHLSADDVCFSSPMRERLAKDLPSHPPLPANWPKHKSPLLTDKMREHFGWQPTWSLIKLAGLR